ncbi:MAG: diacylglycerol kinase family lipid kinase [Clostridia bacterium]|nr:diacylglycerol kinase family lipid kinase [Clostridia bacterium]
MDKRVLLIVNPFSGKLQAKNELMRIVKTLCDADFSVSIHITRCRKDATRVTEERAKNFDTVIACGGDGTLNEVMTGVIRSGYTGEVGFLPAGTTNDLAATLKLPRNLVKAAELITYGAVRPVDYGSFNKNQFFAYIASFGAFTETSYNTDQKAKNVWGHLAYLAEGIGSVGTIRPYNLTVTCDGERVSGSFVFGAAANSLSIGGIVKLKPEEVDLTDGMHELLLVRTPEMPGDLSATIGSILAEDFDPEHVILLRGKRMEFHCREEVPWCLDGEFAGKCKTALIETLPERLRIIRP